MDNLPLNHTKWNDRLAFDVALTLENSGETLQEVMSRHNISANDILAFNGDPVFLKNGGELPHRDQGEGADLQAQGPRPSRGTAHHLVALDP